MQTKNKGFTLTEVIVVITILAILVGVTIGSIYAYVGKAKENTDLYNLDVVTKTMSTVMIVDEINSYAEDNNINKQYHMSWTKAISNAELETKEDLMICEDIVETSFLDFITNTITVNAKSKTDDTNPAETLRGMFIDYAKKVFTGGLPESMSGKTFNVYIIVTNGSINVSSKLTDIVPKPSVTPSEDKEIPENNEKPVDKEKEEESKEPEESKVEEEDEFVMFKVHCEVPYDERYIDHKHSTSTNVKAFDPMHPGNTGFYHQSTKCGADDAFEIILDEETGKPTGLYHIKSGSSKTGVLVEAIYKDDSYSEESKIDISKVRIGDVIYFVTRFGNKAWYHYGHVTGLTEDGEVVEELEN